MVANDVCPELNLTLVEMVGRSTMTTSVITLECDGMKEDTS